MDDVARLSLELNTRGYHLKWLRETQPLAGNQVFTVYADKNGETLTAVADDLTSALEELVERTVVSAMASAPVEYTPMEDE